MFERVFSYFNNLFKIGFLNQLYKYIKFHGIKLTIEVQNLNNN